MNEITKADTREPALVTETTSMLGIIARAASDPAVDVAKMAALLDMQERIVAKRAEAEFNQAFAALAARLPRIKKNGIVEYPKNKNNPDGPKEKAFAFATFEDIDRIIRPLMIEHGFSLSFTTAQRQGDGGGAIVTGTLLHSGGHAKSASIPVALDTSGGKNNIQAMGSSVSYGKRYTTTMLLNLVFEGEDDDGNRGGTVYVTEQERAELERVADEAGADLEAFCRYLQVDSLKDVERKDYPAALNALMAKLRKKRGAPA